MKSSGVASASQTNPQAVGFDSGSLDGSAQGVLQALGISIPPEYTNLMVNLPNLYVVAVARDIASAASEGIRVVSTPMSGAGAKLAVARSDTNAINSAGDPGR